MVNKMNEWMLNGLDINTMMPYLSRYLGHSSIEETHYYYHTIEHAFTVIREHNAIAKWVIPEVMSYEE